MFSGVESIFSRSLSENESGVRGVTNCFMRAAEASSSPSEGGVDGVAELEPTISSREFALSRNVAYDVIFLFVCFLASFNKTLNLFSLFNWPLWKHYRAWLVCMMVLELSYFLGGAYDGVKVSYEQKKGLAAYDDVVSSSTNNMYVIPFVRLLLIRACYVVICMYVYVSLEVGCLTCLIG